MKKLLSLICAAAMSVGTIAATSTTASAAPYQAPRTIVDTSNVINAQWMPGERRMHRGFHRRGGHPYYNNYRGYRHQRPGYRYHGGYWFPGGAFIAGAIIGGALAQPRADIPYRPRYYEPRRASNSHVQWCYDRYRSYRASDNTFQPYNGPRRQCVSPYY